MKKVIGLLVVGLFLLTHFSIAQQTTLSAADFESAIQKDSVQILDVRTPGEYRSGHIAKSMLANWNDAKEFNQRLAYIDKTKPVYVYCLAGVRSAAAAQKMRAEGFTNVYELKGGINAWKAGNKSLEGNTSNKPEMSVDSFSTVINAHKIVLVDFGAEWCPPCKKMEPVVKNLVADNPNKFMLLKVDGGRDLNLLKKYNVETLPVFIIFKDGKEVWRHADGLVTEAEFEAALAKLY